MRKLLREPLVHFLAIGVLLFVVFEIATPDDASTDGRTIVVDRNALLTFVQYRSKAFNAEVAGQRLEALSDAELQRLIDDFVREEALHREALALGMDKNDYVIKQRMIQSLKFVTNGFVASAVTVSDDEIATYYEENKTDYFVDPYATFTHVYFSSDRHGRQEARALALAKLEQLNAEGVPFSESTRHGDRFLYNVNYVERTEAFVASHFGQSMAADVFRLQADEARWFGPFESAYGYHLVMLTRRTEGIQPPLGDIYDAVRDDALRLARIRANDEAEQAIVDTYEIRMDYERGRL